MPADDLDLVHASKAIKSALAPNKGDSWVCTEPHVVWNPRISPNPWAWVGQHAPGKAQAWMAKDAGGWYHIPDIAVIRKTKMESFGRDGGILIYTPQMPLRLVVEIDGGVHDHKATATEERNNDYIRAGVPFIAVSKSDCEARKVDWIAELERHAREVLA